MLTNEFDPFAEQERLDKAAEDRERLEILARQDFKALAEKAEGRRFLRVLLAVCGIDACSYIQGDSHSTAFLEGKRSVGLWVLARFKAFPGLYQLFVAEGLED